MRACSVREPKGEQLNLELWKGARAVFTTQRNIFA